jgi:hypothetical protein
VNNIAVETTGCRLRDALAVRGIDPGRFAKKIGCSLPTVMGWILQGEPMGSANIIRSASVLRVRPAWLALGEDPMFIECIGNAAVTPENCLAIFAALPPDRREAWILNGCALLSTTESS